MPCNGGEPSRLTCYKLSSRAQEGLLKVGRPLFQRGRLSVLRWVPCYLSPSWLLFMFV